MVHGRWCHYVLPNPGPAVSDVENGRVGAERNPLNTEVIYYVNDLDEAPPQWNNDDVRSLAKASAATDGSNTLGVAAGSRQFVTDQLLSKADVTVQYEHVQLSQDPQTELSLLRESQGVSRINHILRVHSHTNLDALQRSTTRSDGGLSNGSSQPSEGSVRQATLSTSESGIGLRRVRDMTARAHLGALIAAKPRIQDMIQDEVWESLVPEKILEEPSPKSSRQLPPLFSAHLTMISKRQHG